MKEVVHAYFLKTTILEGVGIIKDTLLFQNVNILKLLQGFETSEVFNFLCLLQKNSVITVLYSGLVALS